MMKNAKKKLCAILLSSVSLLYFAVPSAFAEDFYLSYFYAPPAHLTNDTQYDYIKDAHMTYTFNEIGTSINTITESMDVLDKTAARGMKGIVADDRIWYLDMLTNAQIDEFITSYKDHPGFGAGYVRDEPYASRWNGFARAYNRYLYYSPNSLPYANLFPYYADKYTQLEVSPSEAVSQTKVDNWYAISSATTLGQTFTVPSTVDYIQSIELQIDSAQWGSNEGLTLTLWDSESKTSRISSTKRHGPAESPFVKFELMAQVNPDAMYYWELTHDGGGDDYVTGVTSYTISSTYPGGTAFVNGVGQSWDFYFKVFSGHTERLNSPITQISENRDGGLYVSSSNRIGQKFTTTFDMDYISFIELNIDYTSWSSSEELTLELWDNPSKTTLIASDMRISTTNGELARFNIDYAVTPNTSYYWELTHNGGGDNSVGKIKVTPTAPAYPYMLPNGSAYVNGIPQSYDMMFKVFEESTIARPLVSSQTKQGTGESVSNANQVGQTFTTSDSATTIDFIQLLINDKALNTFSWEAGSTLTMKLWDSLAKTQQIGSTATLVDTNDFYDPKFYINAAVSPNTTYYWEVTHSGGDDDYIVLASSWGDELPGHAAYANGSPLTKDMVFKVYGNRYSQDSAITQTDDTSGDPITSASSMGQTFKMPSGLPRTLQYIEVEIDHTNWTSDEVVTLILYDGTAKTNILGSASLKQTNNGFYPRFYILAELQPNATYYYEVTHNGGGDDWVGLLAHSTASAYGDGTGYVQGVPQSWDMYFRSVFRSTYARDYVVAQTTEGSGGYITSGSSMGQTFKTPVNLKRRLESIELMIDPGSWSAGEALTLTVYDSITKNQIMGQRTLTETNNGLYPRFIVNAKLAAGTTYYFEVTHNSGGDDSIGWAVHSDHDVYANGTGYVQGVSQSWDMYFRSIFSNYYSDYLEEWVDTVGPNSLKYISFDAYPFRTNNFDIQYILNLELARDMGMQKKVRTHMFLQSVGDPGYIRPTEEMMRYNVYTGLAYGMKGLSWYTWYTFGSGPSAIIDTAGNPSDLYAPVQVLNAEITAIGPKLMDFTSLDVFHSGTFPNGTQGVPQNFFWQPASENDDIIVSYFKDSSNRKYIMVVNKSMTSTGTFSFNVNPMPPSVTEISKITGLEVATNYNSSTGVLSDSFLAGEGRLYALPAGY